MLVKDVMTRHPVSVTGDCSLKQAAVLLTEQKVSALPVLDAHGRVCGIVSEADLIRDVVTHDPRAHQWTHASAPRSQAVLVSEVMTSPAVTVEPGTDLAEVVGLMTTQHFKTVPVVDRAHRVVGMVSRSDVIRVRARADASLEQEVVAMLLQLEHPDWLPEVHDGVVEIAGPATPLERAIAEVTAGSVAGVVEVRVAAAPSTSINRSTP